MKKIISIFLVVLFIISACPVFAENKTDTINEDAAEKAYSVLQMLEVIPTEFESNDVITRAEFICAVLKLLKINPTKGTGKCFYDVDAAYWACDEIETALNLGLVYGNGENLFHPDELLKKEEAEIILLRALNYGEILKRPNGFSKKSFYSKELGLFDGISTTGTSISRGEAYIMLFNAACAPYLQEASFSEDSVYYAGKDAKSLMETFLQVKQVEAVILANDKTGLFGKSPAGKDCVLVNDETLYDPNNLCKGFLGYEVEVYVRTNEPYEIIGAHPTKRVQTAVLKADELQPENKNFDKFCLVTLNDSTGKSTSYNLDPNYDCSYNGVVYSDFTVDTFDIQTGQIRLIDNNKDSLYEVVFIETYTNFVVDNISAYYEKVWDLYTTSELDLSATDDIEIMFSDGKVASFGDISKHDVLSVFYAPDGKPVKLYISKIAKMLIPDGINESEHIFTAGDNTYSVSQSSWTYFDIELGKNKTYRFDYTGEIAAVDEEERTAYYGYLLGVDNPATSFLSKAKIQVLTENSEIAVFSLGEKVYYNDNRIDSKVALENFMTGNETNRQLIMYYVNNDGIVTKLWKFDDRSTTESSNSDSAFSLDYVSKTTSSYRPGSMCQIDSKYFLNDETKIFCVLRGNSEDPTDFACRNYQIMQEKSGGMDFELYNIQDDYNVPVMISYERAGASYSRFDPFMVVDEVVLTATEEGEPAQILRGYSGKNYVSYQVETEVEDEGIWNSQFAGLKPSQLKKGDVIQYQLSMGNVINSMKVFYTGNYPDAYDEAWTSAGEIPAESMYAEFYSSSADVLSHKNNTLVVLSNRLQTGQEEHVRTLPLNKAENVYVCDSNFGVNGKLFLADSTENLNGCRIFFILCMNSFRSVVIYR